MAKSKGRTKANAKAKAPAAQAAKPVPAVPAAPASKPAPPPAAGQATASPERTLRLATVALAVIGLAVSTYLTIVHYAPVPLVCLGTTGCEEVNRSIYSLVAGVPVALVGAAAYLAMLAVLWAESLKVIKSDEALLAVFGLALAGVLYSAYLTYIELAVLRAVCIWCVTSAAAITAIFALSFVRLRATLAPEARPVKGKAR